MRSARPFDVQQALVETEVELALPRLQLRDGVRLHLDLAAQRLYLIAQRLEVLEHLHQRAAVQQALDTAIRASMSL
jgi:hypothetical protein